MESQNIMELEALMPVEMDAGLVFSGVPTGNKIWGYQNPCLPPMSGKLSVLSNHVWMGQAEMS